MSGNVAPFRQSNRRSYRRSKVPTVERADGLSTYTSSLTAREAPDRSRPLSRCGPRSLTAFALCGPCSASRSCSLTSVRSAGCDLQRSPRFTRLTVGTGRERSAPSRVHPQQPRPPQPVAVLVARSARRRIDTDPASPRSLAVLAHEGATALRTPRTRSSRAPDRHDESMENDESRRAVAGGQTTSAVRTRQRRATPRPRRCRPGRPPGSHRSRGGPPRNTTGDRGRRVGRRGVRRGGDRPA